MALTKSQINKLGEKLRHEAIDADNLERLQDLRTLYDAPMAKAQAALKEKLRLDATSRLKTVNTIIDKLRREKMRLAEMQDIAGLRIVEEMGLGTQNQMVERIAGLFDGARIVDRRQHPSYGYRAVHVIPEVHGYPVEIQVRTRLQDLWAQSMERLGDQAGREVRYGGVPEGWEGVVQRLMSLSDTFRQIEEHIESIRTERIRLPPPREASSGQRELRLLRTRLDARLKSLQTDLTKLCDAIRDNLRGLVEGSKNDT